MAVQVGLPAPAFEAQAYDRSTDDFRGICLDHYQGRWLLLHLYALDFTEPAAEQVIAFDRAVEQLRQRGCDLLGCSADSHYAHKSWCDAEAALSRLNHPLLSDLTKYIAMDYGVLVPDRGVALPGTFLIDPAGVLRWMSVSDADAGGNVDEALRILDDLQRDRGAA